VLWSFSSALKEQKKWVLCFLFLVAETGQGSGNGRCSGEVLLPSSLAEFPAARNRRWYMGSADEKI
jgi:hypothetical protein